MLGFSLNKKKINNKNSPMQYTPSDVLALYTIYKEIQLFTILLIIISFPLLEENAGWDRRRNLVHCKEYVEKAVLKILTHPNTGKIKLVYT